MLSGKLFRHFGLRAERAAVPRTENPRVGGSIPALATNFYLTDECCVESTACAPDCAPTRKTKSAKAA